MVGKFSTVKTSPQTYDYHIRGAHDHAVAVVGYDFISADLTDHHFEINNSYKPEWEDLG